MADRRDTFLIEMYNQMFNDINRHILVIWQSAGLVVGAFAIYALVEKQILPLDLATAIMVLLCGWHYSHLVDASYWYNRNLAIISNIERQFLEKDDQTQIHYYFGLHRQNKMIMHFRLQAALGLGLLMLVLLYHFTSRVRPTWHWSLHLCDGDFMRWLPYLVGIVAVGFNAWLHWDRNVSFAEFERNSPGKPVDTSGIQFGRGHGFRRKPEAGKG
jgi:hypothetical protein